MNVLTDPEQDTRSRSSSFRNRVVIFVLVCVFAAALAVIGVLIATDQPSASPDDTVALDDSTLTSLTAAGAQPMLLFENTSVEDHYGQLAAVPASEPDGLRRISEMQCERV